ncbi:Fe2+-dependent dioxygenase [Sphingomonas sp. R647]|uniref:Fe2+-dependent dioxygenase n=1 Tax=Sphingomonas sp. R647 TaxID=2875233 RepID=UPI001CD53419|nr:Fe2+-dependent dioxygenase [Sphingomonas sp. R647]MCA1196381.1 Fe2+-dependent dioxygenase [Sphingomonas sp. R647]
MMIELEKLLDADAVRRIRALIEQAPWTDGKATAGYQSALAKNNEQLPEDCSEAREAGAMILAALEQNLVFRSVALPRSIFPPLFNRYGVGHGFGSHIDNAWRPSKSGASIRTDLSATLFLSDPNEYDGGELVIEDGHDGKRVKLPAGHLFLYPATSLHSVSPVTRGTRVASFFWIESLVADTGRRDILFDMDIAIQSLRARVGDEDAALIALTGCYHNLVRSWSAGSA